jgi:flagellar protein FliJ
MAFKFRYKTLLNVRKIRENIAQQALSQAQKHLSAIVLMKEQVTAKRETLRVELMTRMKEGISSNEVRMYYTYLTHLENSLVRMNENLKTAQKQVDEKREALLKAKKESKAIARLKEIHEARYEESERKKEMNFLDEVAILRFGGER